MLDTTTFRDNDKPVPMYLVARIKKPAGWNSASYKAVQNSHARPGAEKLGDEVRALLKNMIEYDYMGAAEFEFGSCPSAMIHMAAQANQYDIFQMTVDREAIPAGNWLTIPKEGKEIKGTVNLYILCHEKHDNFAIKSIRELISDEKPGQLKERTRMAESLKYTSPGWNAIVAWFDIVNGIFWSTDEQLVTAMGKLLCGIDVT